MRAAGARSCAAGAEIFAETLVDELRARDHEAELVTVPFKWYPGARVLTQAFLWRLLDLRRRTAGRSTSCRDEVPLLLRPPPEQARLGRCTSSGRPTSSTEPIWGSSPKNPRTGRCGARSNGWTGSRSARRSGSSRPPRNVADRLERSTGLAPEVMPHPPQELPYRCEATATSSSR